MHPLKSTGIFEFKIPWNNIFPKLQRFANNSWLTAIVERIEIYSEANFQCSDLLDHSFFYLMMKNLHIFFIVVCLLKVCTFSVKEIVGKKEEEYTLFYQGEAYRKYQEHSRDYNNMEYIAKYNHNIPATLIPEYQSDTAEDKTKVIFHRKWYQGYAHKIARVLPSVQWTDITDRRGYPAKLLNTVREGKAKGEVDSIFEKYGWFDMPRPSYLTKGLISEIHEFHGDVLLKLIPYSYPTNELPYAELTRGDQSMPVYSNPFYFTGNLKNWSCAITNPVSCEIQTIHFE